jgi:predicted AAA+ superfamily ATPase
VYQNPSEFFDRTFLTRNLRDVGAEVIRRLAGIRTGTSAVFNMTTQFGGGKTHALTLLYHLAANGPAADGWTGVPLLLDSAGVRSVPRAATAVFVGTEFDSIAGRGGADGTPVRRTPWGEVAYQLGGAAALRVVQAHEEQGVAPAGDVIRAFLPADRPCLILMDELMNYVSRNRRGGLAAQLYNFLQNLSEEARGRDNMVLAVSVPASELEMNADDQEDYERFKKLLDRVGKAVFMSVDAETSEIIRRRLFEWDERLLTPDGRVQVTGDALATSAAYAAWILEHRHQLPSWFPADSAREAFAATYPFHPMVLSVFERKWQALPRFQRTRGVLRLLALWVSRAYADGFKGAHRDPLISLGTAPLDEPFFRAAVFEQLGADRLEAAVTTDICGKKDSHTVQLDEGAVDTIRKTRLHRKVATDIFFESNGGQTRDAATVPEIRGMACTSCTCFEHRGRTRRSGSVSSVAWCTVSQSLVLIPRSRRMKAGCFAWCHTPIASVGRVASRPRSSMNPTVDTRWRSWRPRWHQTAAQPFHRVN